MSVSNTNATSHYITFFSFLEFPFLSLNDDHQTIEIRQSNLVLCVCYMTITMMINNNNNYAKSYIIDTATTTLSHIHSNQ